MRLIIWFLIGFTVAVLAGFGSVAYAYTVGELDTADLTLMTLENSPQTRCSLDAPQIMVSNDAEFKDAYVGQYMFTIWDLETSNQAEERLQKDFVPLAEYKRYVTFGIAQDDVTGLFGEDKQTLSYGWKYAKLMCEYTNNGVCVDPNGNPISLDQYVGVVATDYPRTDIPPAECPVIEPDLTNYFEGTSKGQVLGLITQIENLVSNSDDAGKVLRSTADLYSKVDEVLHELHTLRVIVNGIEETN